jgi:uncharacterized membrane protein
MAPQSFPPKGPPEVSPVLERNIAALIARRRQEESGRTRQERIADAITRFAGRMPFVYLHLAIFGAWVVINLPGMPWPKFDPSFVTLAMVASVEAIFLSTFVLITQNRLARQADKRADLDLQISLLTEHEITRLVGLVSATATKLGVEEANDPSLVPLKQDVVPEQVLERLDAEDE